MKSKEIIDNDKLNVKVNNILQVKQISNEFIQYNNYYTSTTKLSHEQREQSQSIEIPETEIESKDKQVENQTNKLEREENVTYTTENMKKKQKFNGKIWKKNQDATF